MTRTWILAARIWLGVLMVLMCEFAHAEKLIPLRNGLTLRGIYLEVATLDENAFSLGADGGIQNRPIWMVDDGLRRTYVHRRGMVNAEPVDVPDLGLRIELVQPTPDGGDEVGSIGQILGVSPLNEYGRRRMTVRGVDGAPTIVHQGLTELTARYAKLEGLKADRSIRLDMRVATNTIDTPALLRIFRKRLDQNDPDQRLETVRFFIEAERYGDARRELQDILDKFPEQAELRTQLTALVERQAIQLIEQAKLRRQSGQPQLAKTILEKFPLARVGRVTRLRVEDELSEIKNIETQRDQTLTQLKKLVKTLPPDQQPFVTKIVAEIDANLSANTLPRLSDFIRAQTNEAIPTHQRLALAIAGWIQGNGSGETNLKLALSVIQVRELVQQYLAHPDEVARKQILDRLKPLEAAQAETIAQLLPLIPPPLASEQAIDIYAQLKRLPLGEDGEPNLSTIHGHPMPIGAMADERVQDMYHVGLNHDAFAAAQAENPNGDWGAAYVVQLPPEYDPLRSYPCVVALHAAGAAAKTQLNWWAGVATDRFLETDSESSNEAGADGISKPNPKAMRLGQAARHGYIVIAPRWSRGGQRSYEYTPREHDAVLDSLRSAMRRFSIDADRVFIAGHGAGGSAAWDIALSHPDIWAGMIAIGAEPAKTIVHYDDNAIHVPVYIIMGEKDGRPLKRNGAVYDDYMSYQHDAMFVMYRGRGKEFFYEESDRIFEWMSTPFHKRPKIPQELDLVTMRSNDRFFWWLEWDESLPDTVLDPILWSENARIKAAKVSAVIGANNEVRITQAPANAFTIWLTPEMPLDFGETITIRYRSRRSDFRFDRGIETMLEDVRRRADRLRPFWGKVTIP